MIRLVHQFDTPRTRPSVAAPKSSGCSCCCCCCIVTTIGASVLTAAAMGRDRNWRPPSLTMPEPEVETVAAPGGSIYRPVPQAVPVIPEMTNPFVRPAPHLKWRVLGFFLFPAVLVTTAVMASLVSSLDFGAGVLIVGLLGLSSYIGCLLWLRKRTGLPTWAIVVVILGIPLLSILEVFAWLSLM